MMIDGEPISPGGGLFMAEAAKRCNLVKFSMTVSGGVWKPFRWLVWFAHLVQFAKHNGIRLIVVNVPPRHGKSELVSVRLPEWWLELHPQERVIVTGYEASFVQQEFARRIRNDFAENPFLTVKLAEDSQAVGHFHTREGGGLVATGVGGPVSGRGGDLVIVDDPMKNWDEAQSLTVRRKVKDWFGTTLWSRREPGAVVVVVEARQHRDDLSGWLTGPEWNGPKWLHVRLPALAEAGDPIGRMVGEPLCPERYDLAALAEIRAGMRSREAWEALYQQAPSAGSAGRLYSTFSDRNVDGSVALRHDLPLQASVDFNSNPHMHVVVGQYDERLEEFTAVDEVPCGEVRTARGAGDALATWLVGNNGHPWHELHLFGDATGQDAGRNTATGVADWDALVARLRARLPTLGVSLRVPPRNPRVVGRVSSMCNALLDADDHVRYRMHPRCKALLRDFAEVVPDDAGLIDKSNPWLTHASDAEGYRVHYLRPTWVDVAPPVGAGARFSF